MFLVSLGGFSLLYARSATVLVLTLLLLPAGASLGTLSPQSVTDDRPEPYPNFGGALAADGDILAVATGGPSTIEVGVPSVDLFHRDALGSWTREYRLASPLGTASFAQELAVSGDTVAIRGGYQPNWWENGLPMNPIYILTREASGSWSLSQVVDGGFGDVVLDGDTLAAAASLREVWIYSRGADGLWTLSAKLARPLPATGGGYGSVMALDGDLLAVAEPYAHDGLPPMVHLYRRDAQDSWTHIDTIGPIDGDENSGFGSALALDDGTLAVGAPWGSQGTPIDAFLPPAVSNRVQRTGAVEIYSVYPYGRLSFQQRLEPVAPTSAGTASFGASLDLESGRLLVGAPGGVVSGSAFVYNVGATLPSDVFTTEDATAVVFGVDVAFVDGGAAVGSPVLSVCCIPDPAIDEFRESATQDGSVRLYDTP